MSKMYKTIFPRQGVWHHIRTLVDIGEVIEYIVPNYTEKHIVVITICNNDMRKWVINSQNKVLTFNHYLINNISSDDLKLRIRVELP